MYITELFDPAPEGYYDGKDDNTTLTLDNTRKTRITFAHLNKLRISHDVHKIEHENKLDSLAMQYNQSAVGSMGGGLGGGLGGGMGM